MRKFCIQVGSCLQENSWRRRNEQNWTYLSTLMNRQSEGRVGKECFYCLSQPCLVKLGVQKVSCGSQREEEVVRTETPKMLRCTAAHENHRISFQRNRTRERRSWSESPGLRQGRGGLPAFEAASIELPGRPPVAPAMRRVLALIRGS